jgi:putative peptide-modifying radical SAM enzyme
MHYHLILTEKCNSECKYCYEKSMKEFDNKLKERFKFDYSNPPTTKVDIQQLKEFLSKDKEAVLIFYGGEPLLEIDKIKEIIDNIDCKFRMQTNGKLLDQLPIEYLNKIDKILVSLDGDKERTDENRGKGTYEKVMENIQKIKKKGYKGELIARMTICYTDLFEQATHLIEQGFTSVHWQLDAGFYEKDYTPDFRKFAKSYNNSVEKLITYWIMQMEKGKVIKLYPFLGVVESLLKGGTTKLRCGAGHSGYAITTDGKVVACPIMNCITDFQAGTLESLPGNLKKFEIEECSNCSHLDLCGGRCLYWRKAKLWPKEGDQLICRTIKFYIDKLKENLLQIKELIEDGKIRKEDFEYEKYFGPEIIP